MDNSYNDDCADGRFKSLEAERQAFFDRCKAYAALTIPRLCTDEAYLQNNNEMAHDYQSVGAQCVNVLSNKLMLALFAPSRPFFRYSLDTKTKEGILSTGVPEDQLTQLFAGKEQEAVDLLEQMNCRPVLFELIQLLIVTGNALLLLPPKGKDVAPRVYRLENYVVKRDCDGEVMEVIIKQQMQFCALKDDVQEYVRSQKKKEYQKKTKVCLYSWYRREGEKFHYCTYVDDCEIDIPAYRGEYTKDTLPVRPQVWSLSSGADYGTGIVEDFSRDFAAISILSESSIQGAILISEFRWLADPGGQTRPEDVTNSKNGSVLPGREKDLTIVTSGAKGADLQVVQSILNDYKNRVYTGFLVLSGAIRDSERTTAEEVRMTANELETQLGGGYTRISVGLQVPMAQWLSDKQDLSIKGTRVRIKIVTGLNAMSRSGDSDKLVQVLGQLAVMATWAPEFLASLKVDAIQAEMFAGAGLVSSKFVRSQAEMQQAKEQAQQEAVAMQAAGNMVDAATQPQPPTRG